MKRYRYIFLLLAMCITGNYTFAQANGADVDPLVQYKSKDDNMKFSIGGRFMADAAYLHSEFTPLKSGASITDARIRTSFTYNKLYFYADFDFSKGTFKQKNIFARYNFCENQKGIHSVKAGYYAEPSNMAYNTSLYNYHFMSRPAAVNALAPSRALGVSYKYYNTRVMFDQGIFMENKYNDQNTGNQGVSASGRWLYKAISNKHTVLHIGASLRYARFNTGKVEKGVFKTEQTLSSSLQTLVDPTAHFLNAYIPWARNNFDVSAEALYKSRKFFARGEYLYKEVGKKRPDKQLFNNQLGGMWSWSTLKSWRKGNPIRTSKFSGAYLELGYLLKGDKYTYDHENGLLKGMGDKNSVEIVARYSYTNLNDINSGDVYLIGNGKFYPKGVISDYPPASTSIAGGRLHAFTIGLNYALNQYFKIMGEYQYADLDNVRIPMDKTFHTLQMRVMFSF